MEKIDTDYKQHNWKVKLNFSNRDMAPLIMWLQFAAVFFWDLISYLLRNEEKCFALKAPPPPPLETRNPWGVVLNVVFFSWNNNNLPVDSEFHRSLQLIN